MRQGYVELLDVLLDRGSSFRSSPWSSLGLGAAMFISSAATSSRSSTAGGSSSMSARRPARASKRPSGLPGGRGQDPQVIPARDRDLIVDNIGLPARAYNLAFTDGSTIGVNDGVIQVALKEGHAPTADYVASCAQRVAGRLPGGDLLLSGRRHGDPDPEFRPAGADRRPYRRL